MPFRIASHVYRNRHGTFYFRLTIPVNLRTLAKKTELRFSLQTEQRQTAIIMALPLIADLPSLLGHLQHMADNEDSLPPDFFKLWRVQMLVNAKLRIEINELKDEVQDQSLQMGAMVDRSRAKTVVKHAHTLGQLKGQSRVVDALVFPWPADRTKLFSELLKVYVKDFSYRAEGGNKKPLGAKSLAGYQKDIEFFIFVMGDVRIGVIDRAFVSEYFNILRQLPANINKKAQYRTKSIPEILAMGDPPQSITNARKKIERASGMFIWALLEKRLWGIDANPFQGFGGDGSGAMVRRPFTVPELVKLFSHQMFVRRKFESTYSFWLMPLAIFTGARLGELTQLDLKDFVTFEGIDCIDFNDIKAPEDTEPTAPKVVAITREKRLKTKNAKRLVPIHPELIRLGLMRYVATLRARNQVYFFPELSRVRRDGTSHAASNWFQRFSDTMGVTDRETVFHSFRHGFITTLLDDDVAPHQVAPLVGHEGELITGKVYWNTKDVSKRKPILDKFTLAPEVLELIPAIELITFIPKA